MKEVRLTRWIDRLLWAGMTAAAALATEQMHDLSGAIVALKLTMTTYAERVDGLSKGEMDHETRIRTLEARR